MESFSAERRGTLVVVNPAAGQGAAARAAGLVRELVEARPDWSVMSSASARDATAIVASCGPEIGLVVAVGGDGTVNEVLNGLMLHPKPTRPALAVVPAGSGNDFARLLCLPTPVSSALTVAATGRRLPIDVGRCNDRWFANAVSLGFDAQVTARAAELKAASGRTGFGLYFSALLKVLFTELRAYDVEIAADGGDPRGCRATLLAVGNGRTYGGGFRILPLAQVDDGKLDVMAVDELSVGSALWRLPFFVAGLHTGMRPVHMSTCETITITSREVVPGQIDGDVFAEDRYEITVEHAAVDVIVP